MAKKQVRNVPYRPPVRVVRAPSGVNIIDKEKLLDIVDRVMDICSDNNNHLHMPLNMFKDIVYDKVISILRAENSFFIGLTINIIIKQINKLLNKYTTAAPKQVQNKEIKPKVKTEAEEYDELCWKKANRKEYSRERLVELHIKLFEEDIEST